jgi:hypothetical protein
MFHKNYSWLHVDSANYDHQRTGNAGSGYLPNLHNAERLCYRGRRWPGLPVDRSHSSTAPEGSAAIRTTCAIRAALCSASARSEPAALL